MNIYAQSIYFFILIGLISKKIIIFALNNRIIIKNSYIFNEKE